VRCALICILATVFWAPPIHGQAPDTATVAIKFAVKDSATGSPLPARIVLTDGEGRTINSFYTKLPGFFTSPDGTTELRLNTGKYQLQVYHGIDYLSHTSDLNVRNKENPIVQVSLQRWYPLKERGWVNGDGHDHLYTDVKYDSLMLDTVRRICLAQGIDFMCVAQGWAGYNDTTWREAYKHFTDENFLLHYGSEMPKYRTGHTWWLGQTTTYGVFDNTMDTTYENQYYQSEHGTQWDFNSLKFPQIPDIEVVQRFRKYDSAVALIAHPTSWWWQKRGNIEKHVTNVAAYLPFSLLAGRLWDGQVIMGYDRDHYYYQNLWFHVLNEGYRMTPVAELDGGYNRTDKFYYGSMRTYYLIDGNLTIGKIRDAVKKGHTFVTSGPILMATVDSLKQFGDVVEANGKEHTLRVEALASGDRNDHLSYVVLIRNGRPLKVWDLRKEKPRQWRTDTTLTESEDCWYALKVYGARVWSDSAMLDVMKYCSKELKNAYDSIGTESDVAISSPFYFRKSRPYEPAVLNSKVELTLNGQTSSPINAELLVNGEVIKKFVIRNGRAKFEMPVHALIKLSTPNKPPVYRTLYLDYPPYRQVLEQLASGRWLKNYPAQDYKPGEVPWSAFQFRHTKTILSNVRWNINLQPNERDSLWASFNKLFGQ
jgi:hypothetical protein